MLHWLFFWHRYNPKLDYQDNIVCGTCVCYKESLGYNCRHMIYNGKRECGEWPR